MMHKPLFFELIGSEQHGFNAVRGNESKRETKKAECCSSAETVVNIYKSKLHIILKCFLTPGAIRHKNSIKISNEMK